MVTLVAMTQMELDEYVEPAIQSLADELMRANDWAAEQSLAAALQSFDTLLPERAVNAPNQVLCTIHADGARVGVLWYGIRGAHEAIVWDLFIDPSSRGRGYAAQAMAAMEQELRQANIGRITLNVFTHNQVAARLYSRLGYASVSTRMSKKLA